MLHGIDISNWQKGLTIPDGLDFIIAKATEGIGYVDPCCDKFITQARNKNMLFGFYHFARNNNPEKEAVFFRDNTKGYECKGIPVLDIEDESIKNWGDYARRFVDKYHAITGVWPLIYCSAGHLGKLSGYRLESDCGLWVAGYPSSANINVGAVPKFPYKIAPWNVKCIWQYSSSAWLSNWDEPVDADIAYLDSQQWMRYALGDNKGSDGDTQVLPKPDVSKEYVLKGDGIEVTVKLG